MKICSKCKIEQSISLFCKDKTTREGIHPWCKDCRTESRMKWFYVNKSKHHKSYNKWYFRNKDKQHLKIRVWRLNNKDWMRDYLKVWKVKNKLKIREYRAVRRSLLRANGGSFKLLDWRNMKNKYKNTCLGCGKSEPEIILSIDHIIPISQKGETKSSNIQPLCISCNSKKWKKTIDYRGGQYDTAI